MTIEKLNIKEYFSLQHIACNISDDVIFLIENNPRKKI